MKKDWFNQTITEWQKTKDIYLTLKNPKIWYTNIYDYSSWKSKEYFAPCIIFEIKKWDSNYYTNQVIVLLIKEIYKYDENGTLFEIVKSNSFD